jgi:flagellar biogenesis protein FliO
MNVLASITLGRCAIHLVKAGDRRLLVGTDPGGVKALVELAGFDPATPRDSLPNTNPPDELAGQSPAPLGRDEILNLLLRLRATPTAPTP